MGICKHRGDYNLYHGLRWQQCITKMLLGSNQDVIPALFVFSSEGPPGQNGCSTYSMCTKSIAKPIGDLMKHAISRNDELASLGSNQGVNSVCIVRIFDIIIYFD